MFVAERLLLRIAIHLPEARIEPVTAFRRLAVEPQLRAGADHLAAQTRLGQSRFQ